MCINQLSCHSIFCTYIGMINFYYVCILLEIDNYIVRDQLVSALVIMSLWMLMRIRD
jgi:hypothetical protein